MMLLIDISPESFFRRFIVKSTLLLLLLLEYEGGDLQMERIRRGHCGCCGRSVVMHFEQM